MRMGRYGRIATTLAVWQAIMADHEGELKVFSSHTVLDDRPSRTPGSSFALTAYGFDFCNCPLIEVHSSWTATQGSTEMLDEKNNYFLCVPLGGNDE
jgi:hypothetical protein